MIALLERVDQSQEFNGNIFPFRLVRVKQSATVRSVGSDVLSGFYTVRSSAPSTFSLKNLGSDTHFLIDPIEIEVTTKEGEIIACFREAGISRSGETSPEAIAWLRESLVGLFNLYRSKRNSLGPLPKRQLDVLEKYIGVTNSEI